MQRKYSFKRQVLGTVAILMGYRLCSYIPLPFTNTTYVKSLIAGNGSLGLLNLLTGGNLGNLSIVALGITPYITASIVLQLLGVIVPKIRELPKSGPNGQKRYKLVTVLTAVGLALGEGLGILIGYGRRGVLNPYKWYTVLLCVCIIMLGTLALSCAGRFIDEKLFGNGTSLILLVGILSSYVGDAGTLVQVIMAKENPWMRFVLALLVILGVFVLFLFTTYTLDCEKRITVVYSTKSSQGHAQRASDIPLKLMGGSVVPIIFASTLLTAPALIQSMVGTDVKWLRFCDMSWWLSKDDPVASLGLVLYFLLIVAFSYYYQELNLNPTELSNKLKKHGGTIPGIRPGYTTEGYIRRQLRWLTALGGLCLCVIALVPVIVSSTLHVASLSFLGTSILITVSVIQETIKAYKSERYVDWCANALTGSTKKTKNLWRKG